MGPGHQLGLICGKRDLTMPSLLKAILAVSVPLGFILGANAQSDLGRQDVLSAKPGACSSMIGQSPGFQDFLSLNEGVMQLGLEDQQTAYAMSGLVSVARSLRIQSNEFDRVWVTYRLDETLRDGVFASYPEPVLTYETPALQPNPTSHSNDAPNEFGSESDPREVETIVVMGSSSNQTRYALEFADLIETYAYEAWINGDAITKRKGTDSEAERQLRDSIAETQSLNSPHHDLIEAIISAIISGTADGSDEPDVQLSAALTGLAALQRDGRSDGPLAAFLHAMQASALFKKGDAARAIEPANRFFSIMEDDDTSAPHQWRLRRNLAALLSASYNEIGAVDVLRSSSFEGVPDARQARLTEQSELQSERTRSIDRQSGGSITLADRLLPGGGYVIPQPRNFSVDGILSRFDLFGYDAVLNGLTLLEVIRAETKSTKTPRRLRPRNMGERLRWMGECGEAAGLLGFAGDLGLSHQAAQMSLSTFDRRLLDIALDRLEDWYELDDAQNTREYSKRSDRVDRFLAQFETVGEVFYSNEREQVRPISLTYFLPLLNRKDLGDAMENLPRLMTAQKFNRAVEIFERSEEFQDFLEESDLRAGPFKVDLEFAYAAAAPFTEFVAHLVRDDTDEQVKSVAALADASLNLLSRARQRCSAYALEEECERLEVDNGVLLDLIADFVRVLESNHQSALAYRSNSSRRKDQAGEAALNAGRKLARRLNMADKWEKTIVSSSDKDRGLIEAASVLVFAALPVFNPEQADEMQLMLNPDAWQDNPLLLDSTEEERTNLVFMSSLKDIGIDITAGMDLQSIENRTEITNRYAQLIRHLQINLPEDWSEAAGFDEYALYDLDDMIFGMDGVPIEPIKGSFTLAAQHFVTITALLDEAGYIDERDFILDLLETGVSFLPTDEDDIVDYRDVFDLVQPVLDAAVAVSLRYDRSELGRKASRFSSQTREAMERDENEQTRTYRTSRATYANELWVLWNQHQTSPLDPDGMDRLLEVMYFANRSAAGDDITQLLQLNSAPQAVKDAYLKFAALDYRAEQVLGFERYEARNLALEFAEGNRVRDILKYADETSPTAIRARANQAWLEFEDLMADAGLAQELDLNLSSLSTALRPGEALVSGFVYNSTLVMISVSHDGEVLLYEPRPANSAVPFSQLSSFVTAYSNSLTPSQTGVPRFDTYHAQILFETLFGPIRSRLDDADRIVWVPPRNLDSFPIAGLISGFDQDGQARHLGLEKELMIAPSFSSFIERRLSSNRLTQSSGRVLALGDVAYSYAPNSLSNLPAAGRSLDRIASEFGARATILRGSTATIPDVKARAQLTYDVALFHTHGVGVEIREACSTKALQALALGNPLAASDCAGALLTPDAIVDVALTARVVILAACSTAAAQSMESDALGGVVSAFMLGGADSVVTAHLPVIDSSAAEFGELVLNQIIQADEAPSAAMRSAMLAMSQSPEYAHPIHWAQYELVGEGAAP